MADQEYERDEKLLEARRLRRLELKRKRMIRQRITLGVVFVVIVVLIVVLFRACGGSEDTPPADNTDVTDPASPTEPETPSGDTATATLAAVGDIMVYDSQLADALEADGTYNFLPMLSPVSSYLTAADVTVGNFEANFGDDPVGYPDFRAPASLASTLSGLGFDILQTANTYSIQNGITGLQSTINTVRGAGMDALGTYLSADDKTANQVIVREVNGIRMAFIGFTKGVNNLTLPEGSEYAVDLLYTDYATNYSTVNTSAISAAVAAAQATEPDVIIAMVHWGSEYERRRRDPRQPPAHRRSHEDGDRHRGRSGEAGVRGVFPGQFPGRHDPGGSDVPERGRCAEPHLHQVRRRDDDLPRGLRPHLPLRQRRVGRQPL